MRWKPLINYALFQIGWILSVNFHPQGWHWSGLIVLAIHFICISQHPRQDALLTLFCLALGTLVDSALMHLGIIDLQSQWLAPAWLLMLWLMMATLFNSSLLWLHGRYWLAALLGGLSGSSSYYLGLQLTDASTELSTLSFLVIYTVLWALILPLILWVNEQLKPKRREMAAKLP